jgi:phosphoribosylaminoimidazole (AIR) synthetase
LSTIYKQDGVNVPLGDLFSREAYDVCQSTFGNSPFVKVHDLSEGLFRGPRGYTLDSLPKGCVFTQTADGVGTKSIVVSASGHLHGAARDLVAMCCGDITRYGGLPLTFVNILDVNSLGPDPGHVTFHAFSRLIRGLGKVADEQRLVMLGGEVAELGVCVGSDNPKAVTKFNWGGVATGVYHPDRMILGNTLAPMQAVVALRELGFRSNGLSSARQAMKLHYGKNWFSNPDARDDIAAMAEPSQLYDLFLSHMNGWWGGGWAKNPIKTHLIVHVTGGAIKSKLGEDKLFQLGLSARLSNLWDPPEIMRRCAEWRGMSDQDCYETWGCGNGALVVVDEANVHEYMKRAQIIGLQAKRCGTILASGGSSPKIEIVSKFSGKRITF